MKNSEVDLVILHRNLQILFMFWEVKPILDGYIDLGIVGDIDKRKSTSRYLFTFVRAAVSWQSKLQKIVTA